MKVVSLAGGIGAARFLRGLVQVVDPTDLTVIANTGDDLAIHGLHVSPDLDTITYTLGGGVHPEQGWGRADEHFTVAGELEGRYGRPAWFTLGDRDIATHLVRAEEMGRPGGTLTSATKVIADAWALEFALLPMTDAPVQTMIRTPDGSVRHFQRWWVGERAAEPAVEVWLDGADDAIPPAQVIGALEAADLAVLCPSNPVVSIGTILAVPGIRERLAEVPVVGVSPIVGGQVVRGMADKLLPAVGAEVSAAGVAGLYDDFLDGWVIDQADAGAADGLRQRGLRVAVTDTMMHTPDIAAAVARTAITLMDRDGDQP